MRDIIKIVCLLVAYILYPCVISTHGFNWSTAILGFELIYVTATIVIPDIIKCCKK